MDQVQSLSKFFDWFSGSKVVDDSGRPLVVYHGTCSDFDAFEADTSGASTQHRTAKFGFFFTVDPAIAALFAGQTMQGWPLKPEYASGSNVRPAHVSIKNPHVISAKDFQFRFVRQAENVNAFTQQLLSEGYDGIRVMADKLLGEAMGGEEYGADAWIAFKPDQIKSSISGFVNQVEPKSMATDTPKNQTDTPAFKSWFGNSKIIDANGQPLAVYRGEGSGGERNIYSLKDTRENGLFFTALKEVAAGYERDGAEPRAFYIQADKVLDLTQDCEETRRFIAEWAENYDEWTDRASGEQIDPFDAVQSGNLFDYEGDWSSERWKSLQAEALHGHDAVILSDYDSSVGVFPALVIGASASVKSATNNDGSFIRANLDINRSAARSGHGVHDPLLDINDFQGRMIAAQELARSVRSTGQRLKINSDATVSLFHSTSQANAQAIQGSGVFTGNTWFGASKSSTLPHARPKHGSSTVTLEIKVDPRDIEFSTGTGEFYAANGLRRNEHGLWLDTVKPVPGYTHLDKASEAGFVTVQIDGLKCTIPLVHVGVGVPASTRFTDLQSIGALFDKEVAYFRDSTTSTIGDGFVTPDRPNTIFINESSTITPLAVFGHEFVHQLKPRMPAAYAALIVAVDARLKPGARAAFRRCYSQDTSGDDSALINAELQEITSDIGGDLMSEPAFWSEVFDQTRLDSPASSQGTIEELSSRLFQLLDKILSPAATNTTTDINTSTDVSANTRPKPQAGFNSAGLVSDIATIRSAFKHSLAQYIRQQVATPSGKRSAKTADTFTLERAKSLLSEGANAESVRRATGWSEDNEKFDRYRRSAGEVEARNTQTRRKMSDAERASTPPSVTADTPDHRVIVVLNGVEINRQTQPEFEPEDADAMVSFVDSP